MARALAATVRLAPAGASLLSPPARLPLEISAPAAQPEWSVQGGTIHFGAEGGGGGRLLPASSSKRGEVDPQQLIANALAYAVEIERIV